ncbi:MAG: winged helix-turn-helix domain-containing protein [Candidatus Thermoplasmatota archaeon]
MTNVYEEFGKHAGEIWRTLDKYGPLTELKLKETTKLKDDEFYVAIGWLARENKIWKDGPFYKLGSTNLTYKIGNDAGNVWKLLETKGTIDIYDVSTTLKLDERDIYAALGWLARENKIEAKTPTVPREYRPRFQ